MDTLVARKKRKREESGEIIAAQLATTVVDNDVMRYLTSYTKVTYGGKMYAVESIGQPEQKKNKKDNQRWI